MQDIFNQIKAKKELRGISDSVVLDAFSEVLRKNSLKQSDIALLKKAEIKLLVKETRAQLRRYSGRFYSGTQERKSLLDYDKMQDLLDTHSSTKERKDFYPQLKSIIKNLKIGAVLDLGCGLNPIALAEKEIKYYAFDINEEDLEIVNDFFNKKEIQGYAKAYDLRKIKPGDLPNADLCLIFKVFDILENKGHKLAEKIILSVNCRYILASFPTKTLSGRAMNHPQRGWIERLLIRLGFPFEITKSKNEIFYLIEKKAA